MRNAGVSAGAGADIKSRPLFLLLLPTEVLLKSSQLHLSVRLVGS